jgi:hypothetical protein
MDLDSPALNGGSSHAEEMAYDFAEAVAGPGDEYEMLPGKTEVRLEELSRSQGPLRAPQNAHPRIPICSPTGKSFAGRDTAASRGLGRLSLSAVPALSAAS